MRFAICLGRFALRRQAAATKLSQFKTSAASENVLEYDDDIPF